MRAAGPCAAISPCSLPSLLLAHAQAVGGMLFRCEGCCHAYCEDHLPEEADVVRS